MTSSFKANSVLSVRTMRPLVAGMKPNSTFDENISQ